MVEYDPHHWSSHLFDIKGSLVREIVARVSSCTTWAIVVVLLDIVVRRQWPGATVAIPEAGHSLIGVALGLLLVFRTNTSYDRFWEGRKLWGSITNECRNLVRAGCVFLRADPALVRRLGLWTAAFPYALMYRLSRAPLRLGPSSVDLPEEEVRMVLQAEHVPLAVSMNITKTLAEAARSGLVSDYLTMMLDQNVQLLVDYMGACERIRNTPMPYAYVVHLRRALIVYCLTLPFALVKNFGWVTILITLVISYVMFGIEEIGVEIEDPFDEDANSLPMGTMCRTIQGNIHGMLAEQGIEVSGPNALTPKK